MTLFYLREAVRRSKFKDFENLHIRTRFDFPYFREIADEYDFFVVGSDQVWRPEWAPPNDFLNFVPREKKVSYAASIGKNSIPDESKETFRSGVSDFNYISVREESAIKIIKELTGRDSILVVDPVLLLTADEWLTVAQKPTWFKERYSRGYVLTYHLSKLPPPSVEFLPTSSTCPLSTCSTRTITITSQSDRLSSFGCSPMRRSSSRIHFTAWRFRRCSSTRLF